MKLNQNTKITVNVALLIATVFAILTMTVKILDRYNELRLRDADLQGQIKEINSFNKRIDYVESNVLSIKKQIDRNESLIRKEADRCREEIDRLYKLLER